MLTVKMNFSYRFNLYTEPINDTKSIVLYVLVDDNMLIQYRGTITGLYTVSFGTDKQYNGIMITNNSITTDSVSLSNCTLILSNGNLYNCTMCDDVVLFSCQYPLCIGNETEMSVLFDSIDTLIYNCIIVNNCIGKVVKSSNETEYYEELTLEDHITDEQSEQSEESVSNDN